MAETTSPLKTQRKTEINRCVQEIRAMISSNGVSRSTLSEVKARLLGLATHQELFNTDIFPVQDGDDGSSLYLLSEDVNHEYALYAFSETRGNMTPPHDHTTWAVIAGIEGEELNKFYDRVDDRKSKGHAEIREMHSEVVSIGTGVTLLPEDIHSIHCLVEQPTLNFHLYGRSIEHLPERKSFDMAAGTYKHFPANPNIHK